MAVAIACLILGALGGAVVADRDTADDGEAAADPATMAPVPAASSSLPGSSAPAGSGPSSSSAPAPTSSMPPVTTPAADDPMARARRLAPSIQLPSDCGLPLDNPESLPNAERSYRGGVHEGIDFICAERGRDAVAAMDGRVLVADNSFLDPTPADREAVLEIAKRLGRTPPWTLAMMFGRFVVLDHGVVDGVGHVVSIYAHFEEIDPAIRPGRLVSAGTRLGEIGNRGTETGATGGSRPQAIHLHWEVHVDDEFLAAGLDAAGTREVYAALFGRS